MLNRAVLLTKSSKQKPTGDIWKATVIVGEEYSNQGYLFRGPSQGKGSYQLFPGYTDEYVANVYSSKRPDGGFTSSVNLNYANPATCTIHNETNGVSLNLDKYTTILGHTICQSKDADIFSGIAKGGQCVIRVSVT